jgi:hypothetical protein
MLRKMLIISIFIVSMIGLSNPALATTPSYPLDGTYWQIDGKVTIKLNFPNLVSITLALPKLATLATLGSPEVFVFNGDGTFTGSLLDLGSSMELDIPPLTWDQTGNNFTVDIADFAAALLDSLNASGLTVTQTKPPVFSGKVASNGSSISAKLTIGYNISVDLGTGGPPMSAGTLSVTGSFKGTPAEATLLSLSKATIGQPSKWSIIKNILLDIKAQIPRKGVPQKSRVR